MCTGIVCEFLDALSELDGCAALARRRSCPLRICPTAPEADAIHGLGRLYACQLCESEKTESSVSTECGRAFLMPMYNIPENDAPAIRTDVEEADSRAFVLVWKLDAPPQLPRLNREARVHAASSRRWRSVVERRSAVVTCLGVMPPRRQLKRQACVDVGPAA